MKLIRVFDQKTLIAAMALLFVLSAIVIPVRATTYTYDSSNRLISIDYGQGENVLFSSDDNGNITGRSYTPGISTIAQIAAGFAHTVALNGNGTVWAWGYNGYGQLGDGTTINKSTPAEVSGLTGVRTIAAGAYHSAAVKEDGTVWTWGNNVNWQLGDAITVARSIPVQVSEITCVKAIEAGFTHTLAIKEDGTVWAWGNNSNGKLGDGTTVAKSTPVQVNSLTGIKAITAGGAYTMVIKEDGTVWAWGTNGNGQLGDGIPFAVSTPLPVQVSGLTGAKAIAAGYVHSVALKEDGTVWTWGHNSNGQ